MIKVIKKKNMVCVEGYGWFCCSLVISVNIPAKEHGGTAAHDVQSSSLLFYQGGTLGGEAITLSLSSSGLNSKIELLGLKLTHG
ncbi:hypothetical protein J1N35_031297 [Gossypium stocksii]|uniref:Uncharacterized protein n=1 Tax=Gossypium stocksii TaxID=47602 RepID=A0A9D3ZV73_9ROSI|nr:hypothetical protein J1N35_031297 [Gossypium stocksii]